MSYLVVRTLGRPAAPAERCRGGFTLVELLTVVAVVALLAALLLPALARAKQSARGIQCLSQMRQIGLAIRLYADDHEDTFPRSQHSAFAKGESPWGRAVAVYLGASQATWTNLLSNVYHCPADRRTAPWSYGQNVYFELDPASDDYAGSPQTWRKTEWLPQPAATLLHAENNTAADHIMPHFWQRPADAAEVAQERHAAKSNYSFADGHAAACRFPELYSPEKQRDSWNPALAGTTHLK